MRRKKASSSNVISYAYSAATSELEIEFAGNRVYTYEGISPSLAAQFESASPRALSSTPIFATCPFTVANRRPRMREKARCLPMSPMSPLRRSCPPKFHRRRQLWRKSSPISLNMRTRPSRSVAPNRRSPVHGLPEWNSSTQQGSKLSFRPLCELA